MTLPIVSRSCLPPVRAGPLLPRRRHLPAPAAFSRGLSDRPCTVPARAGWPTRARPLSANPAARTVYYTGACTSNAVSAPASPDLLQNVKQLSFGLSWIWPLIVLLSAPAYPSSIGYILLMWGWIFLAQWTLLTRGSFLLAGTLANCVLSGLGSFLTLGNLLNRAWIPAVPGGMTMTTLRLNVMAQYLGFAAAALMGAGLLLKFVAAIVEKANEDARAEMRAILQRCQELDAARAMSETNSRAAVAAQDSQQGQVAAAASRQLGNQPEQTSAPEEHSTAGQSARSAAAQPGEHATSPSQDTHAPGASRPRNELAMVQELHHGEVDSEIGNSSDMTTSSSEGPKGHHAVMNPSEEASYAQKDLQAQHAGLVRERDSLHLGVKILSDQLKSRAAQADLQQAKLGAEVQRLSAQLTMQQEAQKSAEDKLASFGDQHAAVENERDRLHVEVNLLNNQLKSSSAQADLQQAKLDAQVQHLSERLSWRREDQAFAECEAESLGEKLEGLQEHHAAVVRERDRLHVEVKILKDRLKSSCAQADLQQAKLEAEIQHLCEQLHWRQGAQDSADREAQRLREQLESLQEQHAAWLGERVSLRNNLQSGSADAELQEPKLGAPIQRLSEQLSLQQEAHDSLKYDVRCLMEQLKSLEKQHAAVVEDRDSMRRDSLRNELKSSSSDAELQEVKLVAESQEQLASLAKAQASIQDQLESLLQLFETPEQQPAAAVQEWDSLRNQLKSSADAVMGSQKAGMGILEPRQAAAGSIEESSEATPPAIAAGPTGIGSAAEACLGTMYNMNESDLAGLERTFWNWRDAAALCHEKGYSAAQLAYAVSVATEEQLSQEAEMDGGSNVSMSWDPAHRRAIIDTYDGIEVYEGRVVSPQEVVCYLSIPADQPGVPSIPDSEWAEAFDWWDYATDHWTDHFRLIYIPPHTLQRPPLDSPHPAGTHGNAEPSEPGDLRPPAAADTVVSPGLDRDHGMATAAEHLRAQAAKSSTGSEAASASHTGAAHGVTPRRALMSVLSFFPDCLATQTSPLGAASCGATLPTIGVSEPGSLSTHSSRALSELAAGASLSDEGISAASLGHAAGDVDIARLNSSSRGDIRPASEGPSAATTPASLVPSFDVWTPSFREFNIQARKRQTHDKAELSGPSHEEQAASLAPETSPASAAGPPLVDGAMRFATSQATDVPAGQQGNAEIIACVDKGAPDMGAMASVAADIEQNGRHTAARADLPEGSQSALDDDAGDVEVVWGSSTGETRAVTEAPHHAEQSTGNGPPPAADGRLTTAEPALDTVLMDSSGSGEVAPGDNAGPKEAPVSEPGLDGHEPDHAEPDQPVMDDVAFRPTQDGGRRWSADISYGTKSYSLGGWSGKGQAANAAKRMAASLQASIPEQAEREVAIAWPSSHDNNEDGGSGTSAPYADIAAAASASDLLVPNGESAAPPQSNASSGTLQAQADAMPDAPNAQADDVAAGIASAATQLNELAGTDIDIAWDSSDDNNDIGAARGPVQTAPEPSSDVITSDMESGSPATAQAAYNSHSGFHAVTADRAHAEPPAAAKDEGKSARSHEQSGLDVRITWGSSDAGEINRGNSFAERTGHVAQAASAHQGRTAVPGAEDHTPAAGSQIVTAHGAAASDTVSSSSMQEGGPSTKAHVLEQSPMEHQHTDAAVQAARQHAATAVALAAQALQQTSRLQVSDGAAAAAGDQLSSGVDDYVYSAAAQAARDGTAWEDHTAGSDSAPADNGNAAADAAAAAAAEAVRAAAAAAKQAELDARTIAMTAEIAAKSAAMAAITDARNALANARVPRPTFDWSGKHDGPFQ